MNPELIDLLRQANEAVRRGADPDAIGRRISEMTNGQITSLSALGQAVRSQMEAAPEDPTEAAQRRMTQRGGSAVGDFARMAAQGLTFGFADELVGAVKGDEAMQESRQRVEDLRTLAPGASMMAEIAGGAAVPFGAGTSVSRSLTRPGAGLVARAAAGAAGGASAGAAGGALYGAGEADEGNRLMGALRGGAVGTATGAVVGGALPAVGAGLSKGGRFASEILAPETQGQREARRRLRAVFEEAGLNADDVERRMAELGPEAVIADLDPRLAREARAAVNQAASLERAGGPVERLRARTDARGERLVRALRESSGITESMPAGQEAAERAVQEVRREFYRPLEEAFPEVRGPNVAEVLRDPRIKPVARRNAPAAFADEAQVAAAIRQGVPEAQARQAVPNKAPSFMELQDIMLDLRDEVSAARAAGRPNASRRAAEAYDAMVSAMEQDIPGFAEAQAAYRVAARRLGAYEEGFNAWTRSAREIREAMEELPPEAHDAFRVGLLQRWQEKLLAKEGTTGAVNSILRAGDDMRGQIRAAFGSDEAFQQFLRQRDIERTFRLTEAAVQGNSTTAQQALDALDSAPTTKSELLNRIYEAVLSPGESRRVQAQAVGERLLGNNVQDLLQTLRGNRFGLGTPGAGGGVGAMLGTAGAMGTAPRPPLAAAQNPASAQLLNPSGRNPLADLVLRGN